MKRSISKNILIQCLLITVLLSCSKDDDGSDPSRSTQLTGAVLYDFGEHTYKIDLSSGNKSTYFDRNTYSLNGWDVGRDGKIRLTSEIIAGRNDVTLYRLIDTEHGNIIKEFEYEPVNDAGRDNMGLLSPDNSLIVIKPDLDHGIVIIDTDGKVQHHLEYVNNERLTLGDEVLWLPGNSLLFTFNDRFILRTDPPYTKISPVKEMDYDDWGNLNASFDGSKISLKIGNHIHMMDGDGANLVQVTESNRMEREAVFSPDGKYLLVAADYYPATFGNGNWIFNIIPADGKTYKVGTDPSQEVIPVIPREENDAEPGSGIMLWR